jgi:hypothetical protein
MKYHFTNRQGWDGIHADQRIELSTVNVAPGQLAVVWFSSNPTWDYSARANVRITLQVGARRVDYKLSIQELWNGLVVPQYGINVPPTELFRISVEDAIAPITWAEYRATSNTPAIILNMMEQEKGVVPAEWFASSAAVSRAEWQAVHRWSAVLNEWEAVPIP